jgi:hypothetical protein
LVFHYFSITCLENSIFTRIIQYKPIKCAFSKLIFSFFKIFCVFCMFRTWGFIFRKTVVHRVSQEERSIFWEVIVSVILNKKLYMNMCPISNGFRDRAIWLYSGLAWAPSIVLPSRPAR